jgi:hypothetical protein
MLFYVKILFTEATSQASQKPHKRRVLLLKRKAVTTGIFDSKGKDDYSNKGEVATTFPSATINKPCFFQAA